jgi:hypothetical protein
MSWFLVTVAENVTNISSPFTSENKHSDAVLIWRNWKQNRDLYYDTMPLSNIHYLYSFIGVHYNSNKEIQHSVNKQRAVQVKVYPTVVPD